MAKRFNNPLLVSSVSDWENGTLQIHVTNDLRSEQAGTIEYMITDAEGNTLESKSFDVTLAAGTTACVQTLDVNPWINQRSARDVVVWLQLHSGEKIVSEDLALFSRPKHLGLKQPTITTTIHSNAGTGYDVELVSDHAALYVWLELPDAQFSDNFVHLRPNTPKVIHVATQAIANLKVQSLFDTYQ